MRYAEAFDIVFHLCTPPIFITVMWYLGGFAVIHQTNRFWNVLNWSNAATYANLHIRLLIGIVGIVLHGVVAWSLIKTIEISCLQGYQWCNTCMNNIFCVAFWTVSCPKCISLFNMSSSCPCLANISNISCLPTDWNMPLINQYYASKVTDDVFWARLISITPGYVKTVGTNDGRYLQM